ncbi:MAG: hypothetical protein ACK5B9_03200 [Flavobacteriia bacterium]|jgi:hypothetical protein
MAKQYTKNNQTQQYKSHSGCQSKIGANGVNVVDGWNYTKRHGLVKFVACMVKGGDRTKKGTPIHNKKGEPLYKYVVNIDMGLSGKRTVNGFWNENSQKLYMPELNMVASPNTRKRLTGGIGYWGQIKKRN